MPNKKKIAKNLVTPWSKITGFPEDAILTPEQEANIIVDALDYIKKGVEEQNWNHVCDGYFLITKEIIGSKPPPSKLGQIRELLKEKEKEKIKIENKIIIATEMPLGDDLEEDERSLTMVNKQRQDGITVIETNADEEERRKNQALAATRAPRSKKPRTAPPKDTSDLPADSDKMRVYTGNLPPRSIKGGDED